MIYIDTSAFLAIVDETDAYHCVAQKHWLYLLEMGEQLQTNNYVLVESTAVIQNRVGIKAVKRLVNELLPVIKVDWLNPEQHEAAIHTVLTANRRSLSLVDCASFETMRRLRIETVFTFDEHFKEQGFKVVP